jgi:hypothetical protein
MISHMAVKGRPQRGNEATYDVTSGLSYRTTVNLDPVTAATTVQAARSLGMSVSGLLNRLAQRMEVDETGRPVWADELDADEGRLPIAG